MFLLPDMCISCVRNLRPTKLNYELNWLRLPAPITHCPGSSKIMRTFLLATIAAFAVSSMAAPIAFAAKKCAKGYVLTKSGKCVKDSRGS